MRLLLTAGVLVLLPALGFSGDGLGDAANREAHKRQPKKPPRVFTDEDLQSRGGEWAAAAPAAEEKPAVDALEREREERHRLEVRWRQRFGDARLRLAVAAAASWHE